MDSTAQMLAMMPSGTPATADPMSDVAEAVGLLESALDALDKSVQVDVQRAIDLLNTVLEESNQ